VTLRTDVTVSSRQPLTPPAGVSHVLVNGELAIRDGVATDVRAGKFVTA